MVKEKEKEYFIGMMEQDMKVISKMIKWKGVYYWNDGDRSMGDYSNDKEVGLHVILQANGQVIEKYYE